MYRALLIKELRETIGIALVALAAYLLLATSGAATGLAPWARRSHAIPFLDQLFLIEFVCAAAAFAIALGFEQTVGESVRGTYLFLLHRPIRRNRLIGVKLLVGLGLYLVCSAVPILIYAFWAATPGTHASPFEWSMTAWAWWAWGLVVFVYLGAFLSGLRPACWWGTRLLPLFGAGLLAVLVAGFMAWQWPVGVAASIVSIALLVSNILFEANRRDYS